MIVVISPAKTLQFPSSEPKAYTQPIFAEEAQQLASKLKKLNAKKIADLMEVSDSIAELNFNRFQDFSFPFNPANAHHALRVFKGDVYQGLEAETLSENGLKFADQHLRILSGLYGLLRPFDLMQAYRLEMGTPFAYSPAKKNLYQFWGPKIALQLNEHAESIGTDTLLNLASQEYFKAVQLKTLRLKVKQCDFLDGDGNQYKMISFFAKKARGLMTRFILENQITKFEDLRAFDSEGYIFAPNRSSDNHYVFTRLKP